MQALDSIRILDFTQMMLGPFATQLLADLGADVIKVEKPEGEWERGLALQGGYVQGQSAAFLAMNRNKRSIALDIKDPESRSALLALAETCDVVVENFRPGVMERLGLGYEDFKKVRPDIIFASGSGWGRDTPFAAENRPGQDLLIQAMSGIAASTGRATDPPTPAGTAIVDHATALTLANGILAAIIARTVHGIGQRVDVDLYSTAIALQCQEISSFVNQGVEYSRSSSGVGQAWLSAPFGIYSAFDGWVAVAMADVGTVAGVVGAHLPPELDPWKDRDAIKFALELAIANREVDVLLTDLLASGIWAARVRSTREAVDELRERGSDLIVTVEGPMGEPIELIGCGIRMSETPWQQRLAPPHVGEHTAQILASLGTP
ncbi:MAG: CoA transferase [Rhodoglobus sp.]|nr:CoA transferase [Rhodoglobus sp.]